MAAGGVGTAVLRLCQTIDDVTTYGTASATKYDHGLELMRLFEEGKFKPHVDKVFSFDEAAAAHDYLESAKNVGKIVLTP